MIYKTFIYMGHSKKNYDEEKPLNKNEAKISKYKHYNNIKGKINDPDDLLDDDEEQFEKFKRK
jgi:hypothetical protein